MNLAVPLEVVSTSKKIKQFNIGEQFGNWTVLSYIGEKGSGRNSYWLCKCSCGNEKEVCGSLLRTNKSTKCQKCSGRINGRKGIYSKDIRAQHLYIIQAGNYFKIGVSSNPIRRIKDIQSDCPLLVNTLYIGINEGYEEELWHNIFKHRHSHGEWFKCELN